MLFKMYHINFFILENMLSNLNLFNPIIGSSILYSFPAFLVLLSFLRSWLIFSQHSFGQAVSGQNCLLQVEFYTILKFCHSKLFSSGCTFHSQKQIQTSNKSLFTQWSFLEPASWEMANKISPSENSSHFHYTMPAIRWCYCFFNKERRISAPGGGWNLLNICFFWRFCLRESLAIMTMISELTSTHRTETISCIHSFKMDCLQVMIRGHVLKSQLDERINLVLRPDCLFSVSTTGTFWTLRHTSIYRC